MRFNRKVSACSLIHVLLFSSLSLAVSPYADWRVLESPHFEVFHDRAQRELAEKYIRSAEESYRILSTVFSDLPKKTVIVLDDSTDLTNGSATFLPYDWIQIYPSLPEPGDSLDHFDDWPKTILIHELTHIANFQPASGFYTPLTYLFGTLVTPNSFLPRWYLEGLAVYSESLYTEHGRLRASRTQGIIRMLALSGGFARFPIDHINEVGIRSWPYGERPYLFGSLLQKNLMDLGSKDLRERWNQRYGRRFPFFIEAVPKDEFQNSYQGLLSDTYQKLTEGANQQIRNIKKDGEFNAQSFLPVDHEQLDPRLSPDQKKLAYLSRSRNKTSFWLIERANTKESFARIKPKKILDNLYAQSLEWNRSGSGFYFDAIDGDTPFVNHRRIYFYDLEKKTTRTVTPTSRARFPTQSPSGKRLAFVTEQNGYHRIEWTEGGAKRATALYRGELSERLSSPFFLDENHVAFVSKNAKTGQESLLRVDASGGKPTPVISGTVKSIRFPRLIQNQIWYLSSDNGIDNIYVRNLNDSSTLAKSNTFTWIHSFTVDPADVQSRLIFSQMTLQGLKFFEAPNQTFALKSQTPLISFEKDKNQIQNQTSEDVPIKERSYLPFKYLIPRYWVPFVYPVEDGVILQGSTSATDPVAENLYSLAGSYDTVTKGSSYGLFFQNNSLPVTVDVYGIQFQEYLGASDSSVETTRVGGLLSTPLGFLSKRWNFGLGYNRGSSELLDLGRQIKEGPEAILTFSNLMDTRVENGTTLNLGYEKLLSGSDRVDFDRSVFAIGQKINTGFSEDHYVWGSIKGAFIQGLPLTTRNLLEFGDPSLGGNYLVNLVNSQFLYRGYPSGTFVGRQTLNSNLEYHFPIRELNSGSGTKPYFLKTLNGSIFVDTLAMDGAYYKEPRYRRTTIDEFHFSTGGELQLDTTLAYHLPLTLILGGYWGLSEKAGNNFTLFLGIGAFDPLGQQIRGKSP